MAVYNLDIIDVELTSGTISRNFLNHSIGSGDNLANRYGVRVYRNKTAVDLAGVECEGFFIAPDGQHILISGASYTEVGGNVAYVQLPQACYNVEGQFSLAIKLIGGGITGTIRIVDGVVCNTGYDGAVAPTGSVPTYQEIIAEYNQMVETTTAAQAIIESSNNEYLNSADFIVKGVPNIQMFEKGSLHNGQDDDYHGAARIRSFPFYAEGNFIIKSDDESSSAEFVVCIIDRDGTEVYESEWIKAGGFNKGHIYRLLMTLDKDSVEETSIQSIFSAFTFQMVDGFDAYSKSAFTRGQIDANGDIDYSYRELSRFSSSRVEEAKNNILVVIENGYHAGVTYYTASGAVASWSGWKTGYVIIPKGSYYRLTLDVVDTVAYYTEAQMLSHFRITEIHPDFSQHLTDGTLRDAFMRGTIESDGTVGTYRSTSRVCTAGIMQANRDIVLYMKTGMYYAMELYDDSGVREQAYYWYDNNFYIPAGQKFAFTIAKNPNDDTPVTEDVLFAGFDIRFANEYPYSIQPGVILQARNVDSNRYPPYSKWYIQAAAKNQYDRVRFNVRRTPDGYYVLIHNNTINEEARNSDGTAISEPVNSSGTNYSVLNSYDWGIKYGSKYAGYGVPLLEDAVKYAALYNLSFEIEIPYTLSSSEREDVIDDIAAIISKYGMFEKFVYCSASGHNWSEMQYWLTKSPYVSFSIFDDTEAKVMAESFRENMDALKTGYNTLYVCAGTWGSTNTPEFIQYAHEHGYLLFNSGAMDIHAFFNTYFPDKGLSMIEGNNIYMIKDTIMHHADEGVNTTT